MGQCLSCHGECAETTLFCDQCRSALRILPFRQEAAKRAFGETDPTLPTIRSSLATAVPTVTHDAALEAQPDSALQAISRLNEAAQRIAREDAVPGRRPPRASRLAPFRDISAEITRACTPMSSWAEMQNSTPAIMMSSADQPEQSQASQSENTWQVEQSDQGIQNAEWPDLWPWLDDVDDKESEDIWANRTDPLIARRRPTSAEAALIEQEDIRRALAEGISTGPVPVHIPPHKKSPLRNIFIALAIFAVVALSIDGVLLIALSGHFHSTPAPHNNLSAVSLTLTPNEVMFAPNSQPNQQRQVLVQISNFAKNAQIVLTRDNEVNVQTTQSSPMITMGANGSASVTIIVTQGWGAGYHYLYATDITPPHYSASAQLLVIGAAQSQPAHLELSSTPPPTPTRLTALNFGAGIQGSNQTQQIYLRNTSLSGSITWSASSNQPWLLVSPNTGTFNEGQEIEVAIQRGSLPPTSKPYTGILTFYSNVGPPQKVSVTMIVTSLPSNAAVLSLSPAALSFVTNDGVAAACQTVTISNPGSQLLNWSLTATSSSTESTQIAVASALGTTGNWLTASPSFGSVPKSSNEQLDVCAQSASLLPGAYLGSLQFSAPGSADPSQSVSVSLTVQPNCGLLISSGFLTYTAVQGNAGPSPQPLILSATSSCNAPLKWAAQVSTPSWLSVSLTSGQVKGTASESLAVSVNPAGLAPQKQAYVGYIVFSTPNSSQTVLVNLTVQPTPQPGAPIMSASPLSLNFSTTEGLNSNGQVVTITNNGQGALDWSVSSQPLGPSWLNASPTSGQVPPGQTGTATINVDTSNLSPGTYSGLVTLNGTDSNGNLASGSPQVISVNLVVQPPCALTQPSLSSLNFTAVQGGSNPQSQPVLITGTGNCAWPLAISATPSSGASWLQVNPPGGNIKGNDQSVSLSVSPTIAKLAASSTPYTAQITISATDSAGILAQGSGQIITVALTIEPPCVFTKPAPSSLSFSLQQGAAPGTQQTVALNEKGTCNFPINYTVSTNATWLSLTQPAQDSGTGSMLPVTLSSAAAGLAPGTYQGTIAIKAADVNGVPVSGGNRLNIKVSLTVTPPPTYSVSGTVYACTGVAPACLTPMPLAGATITVLNGTTTVTSVTADASGNYTIPALPNGSYTVNVSGTISTTQYSGTGTFTVNGANITGMNFDTYG